MPTANEASNMPAPKTEGVVAITGYLNILFKIQAQFSDAKKFLDQDFLKALDTDAYLAKLQAIDSGGFSHEMVGGIYGREQLDVKKVLFRKQGYLGIAHLLQRHKTWQAEDILFDSLAGNGTFDRLMQQLFQVRPRYVGNDVSMPMVKQAHSDNRLVFYSDLRMPIVRHSIADYGVSAYGTHHIPPPERLSFLSVAGKRVKPGGTFVVQDFIEGSATARWYSECIDQFRSHGHALSHFKKGELASLLSMAGFTDVSEHLIYDPFVMEVDGGINEKNARGIFYRYLIKLFALDRLQGLVEAEPLALATLDNLFLPYFCLNAAELKAVQQDPLLPEDLVEAVLNIKCINGVRYLIAPRVAVAVAGTRSA